MKATYWIIPVLALAGVVVWNVRQNSRIKEVAQQNAALKSGPPARSAGPRGPESSRPASTAPAGDWKGVATKLAAAETDDSEKTLNEISDIYDRISEMSEAELAAALDEVKGMDLDEDQRASLEELLIDPLIEKNPKLALDKFGDRITSDDDEIGWRLSQALANWAKNDVGAAAKWLDGQIAAGTFESKSLDGRNELLLDYEAALVGELLASNPAEAERRISGLPEEQRREALERITFTDLEGQAQDTYAALIRGLVPADERAGAFVNIMDQIVPESGYEGVDSFFKEVNATPEEKTVAAKQAASSQITEIAAERAVTAADIDAMRGWLQQHSPDNVNETTGHAIAEATLDGGEFTFEQASALLKQYHQQSGDDSLVAGFLESYSARSNLEEALPLAQLIQDPAKRQALIEKLQ